MVTTTVLRDIPAHRPVPANALGAAGQSLAARKRAQREPLMREALGMSLRAYRADKGMTLRDLASAALVSPGYLSELERGRKEVSSEVLASICQALEATVAEVLFEAVANMSLPELNEELATTAPAAAEA